MKTEKDHDEHAYKIGKATNAYRRLRSYVVAYGKTNSKNKCSGIKLFFFHMIPKRTVNFENKPRPLLTVVEMKLNRMFRNKGFKSQFGSEYYTRLNLRDFTRQFKLVYRSSKALTDIAKRTSQRIKKQKKLKRALKKLA